ncbi:hypothetical protein [Candidatus Uabimicrobium amorphum]|uniref:Uncharacterized protein n=1 Tax=Uabimicrobium amorphum TaxID=2596890 RepID=A0A5S9F6C6_UABAM|nr:hypothetical protein [Candidatus Uabimicrobium amorphum]BBM87542.1 hypothetical protein UABAM_05954 [Candidatus Uabimicrobium amorphum]
MSKYLSIFFVFLCCCSDHEPQTINQQQQLHNMRQTFHSLRTLNVNSHLQIDLWNNFLKAFPHNIENEEIDDDIRRKVSRRVVILKREINRKQSTQLQTITKKSTQKQPEAKNVWIQKDNNTHHFSFRVKDNWQETHTDTLKQQVYNYHINRYTQIVFNAYRYGEPLGISQVIRSAEHYIFGENYSDYVPVVSENIQIDRRPGKYIEYKLTSANGYISSAIAFYSIDGQNIYLCYAICPRGSKHIPQLKEALFSLRIKNQFIPPSAYKWRKIDFPRLSFSYQIPSTWESHPMRNSPGMHFNLYGPNEMTQTFFRIADLGKNFNWPKNIKLTLAWMGSYEVVSKEPYRANGVKGQKYIYKAHVKTLPLPPHIVELVYGGLDNDSFMIYSVYPSVLHKSEVNKIRQVVNTIQYQPKAPQKQLKNFKTVYEESFPIHYTVPRQYKRYDEKISLGTVHRIYESPHSQFSFYISREHPQDSLDDVIRKTEKYLQSLATKFSTKRSQKTLFGNILGQQKTYDCRRADIGKFHLTYFFAKNTNFLCVFGFWSRMAKDPVYQKISDSMTIIPQENTRKQIQHYTTVIQNTKHTEIALYQRSVISDAPRKDLSRAIRKNFIFPEAFLARATIFRQRNKNRLAAKDYRTFSHLQQHTASQVSAPQNIEQYIERYLPKQYPTSTPLVDILLNAKSLGICKIKKLRQIEVARKEWQMLDVSYQYAAKNGKDNGDDRRIFFADHNNKVHEMMSRGLQLSDEESQSLHGKDLSKAIANYYNTAGMYAQNYTLKKVHKIRVKKIFVSEVLVNYTYIPLKSIQLDYVTEKQAFAIVPLADKRHIFKILP